MHSLQIHWTKLKYVPIHLCLDEVLVEVETCEQLRPPSNSKPSYSSGGRYGFSDRVVDGMKVVVNSVVVNFQSASFVASFQGPDQLLLFRQLQWQMMRLEAHARGVHAGAPLRLITNGARCRIVLKKRLADCSLVASRLVLVLDELLWALTDAQLVAALHLGHSLAALVRKAAAQGRRHRAASATLPTPDYFSSPSGPPPSSQRGGGGGGGGSGAPKSPLVEFFRQHDVLETSYHLFCTRIDLHLCDDMDPKETRSSWGPLQGGAALQVLLEKLLIDYYPFHGAASSRSQWLKYSEPSCGRQAWVQQMLSQWSERKPSSGSTPGSSSSPTSTAPPRDWRTLMSSCLLVRLEEFSMQQVCMTGRSERRPFLASEGATVLLPGEALHLELTHYYARASPATSPVTSNGHAPVGSPGSGKSSLASSSWVGGSSVPESHLFAYLGPTALRLDLPTVLWAHAFLHSVHKCTAHLSCANEVSPLAVRVEMILPKVGIPQFERERPLWPEEGPEECQELRLGCSRAVATNWRPADRGACLEALGRGPLFFETTSFPWRPSGGGGGGGSVRDPPPVHACFLQEQTSGSEGGGVHHGCGVGEAAQLWSVQLDPCWAEFVDRPGSSRPRAFVEPLPLTLWLGAPTQGGSSRVPLLLYVPAPLRLQLGRRECAFLLRLARSAAIVQEQTAVDRQAIMGPSGQVLPSVSVTAMWPHVEVTLLLPPSSATAAGVPGGGSPSDASERPSSSTTTSEADEVPLRGGMAADDSPDQPLLQPPLPPLVPHGAGEATRGQGNQPWALRKGLASFVAGIDAVLAKGATDGELESVADDDSVSLRSDLSSDSDQLLLATGVLDEVLKRSGAAEVGQDAAELLAMDQASSGGVQGVSAEWRQWRGRERERPPVRVRAHCTTLQLVGLGRPPTEQPSCSRASTWRWKSGTRRRRRWQQRGRPQWAALRALVRGLCVRLSAEALTGLAQLAQVEPPPPRALPVRLLLHGLSVTLLCLVDRTPSGAVYVLPTGCSELTFLQSLARAVSELENSSAGERRQLEEQRAELNRLEGEKHSLLATLQLLQEELSRLERASASSGCDPFCGASNS
ncbi:hypothetical protein HPB48_020992 [Haemaphysalis longicornis]|uniref:Chorein N-terminal domain-containing protein n=1 Tax=Haemaphysalis longicornis TaxID=44386 RepID=A0A9J6GCL4_HAELO|nr:hypothetical protein HPB48_020992 [Haemaphysalis longicornis]